MFLVKPTSLLMIILEEDVNEGSVVLWLNVLVVTHYLSPASAAVKLLLCFWRDCSVALKGFLASFLSFCRSPEAEIMTQILDEKLALLCAHF
jgi:hypothetical protein